MTATPERELEIQYSRGRDKFDAYPEQRTAVNFSAFRDSVLGDRARAKGLTWISAPFAQNGDGRRHRCREGALPRAFLAFDLDGGTEEGFVGLSTLLWSYSGFGYTTASHSADNPHARYILELLRPVDRAEGIRLGMAMQLRIEARQGPGAVKFDDSVYRGEQPIYGPLVGAEVMRYDGDPIDVDQILKDAPPLDERPGRAARTTAIASRDPVAWVLRDRKMIKRDHGDGKLSIACPFKDEHTEPGGESSTVYLLPNFGGVRYGKFACMHLHCKRRQQNDYLRALGLDAKEVWREQAAPREEPPITEEPAARGNGKDSGAGNSKGHSAAYKGVAGTSAGPPPPPEFISAPNLWRMRHEPTRWAVRQILPEGVTLFCGKPKTGKSWLAIHLGISVGAGGLALGAIEVEAGPALYLALEDNKRRLTKRLRILCGAIPPAEQFDFMTDCPRLGSGGEEVLRTWLRGHPTARLIVIDTLARFRPHANAKETPYQNDYVVGEYLSRLCVEFQVSILVLGHLRKQPGDDPIDEISGTLGLAAGVDGYMVLRRQAMSDDATLYVCGRDVEEPAEYCIRWDSDRARWTITEGDPLVSRLPAQQRRVYELLSEAPKNIKELTEVLNPGHVIDDPAKDSRRKACSELVYKLKDKGLIERRTYDGRWWPIPGNKASSTSIAGSTSTTSTTSSTASTGGKSASTCASTRENVSDGFISDQGGPASSASSASDVDEIRGWLQRLGEEDPETISEVLEACARDPDVLAGYLRSAREVPS